QVVPWMVAVCAVSIAAGCRGPESPTGPLPSPGPARATADARTEAGADAGPLACGDAGAVAAAALAATAPCTDETATVEGSAAPHDTLMLTRVAFGDLPGWADDRLAEAVPSFLRSCDKLKALRDDAPVGPDGHGGK